MEENPNIFESFLSIGLDCEFEDIFLSDLRNLDLESMSVLNILPKDREFGDYLDNLKYWAFPQGLRILDEYLHDIMVSNKGKPSDFIGKSLESLEIIEQFVITDEKSIKRYCSSLIFYEKRYIKTKETLNEKTNDFSFLPKVSLKSLINNPLSIKNTGYSLIFIPKALCLISKMPVFSLELQFLELLYNKVLLPHRDPKIDRSRVFRLNKEKNIKEIRLFEFYITTLFSLFTLSEKDSKTSFLDLDFMNPKPLLTFHINNTIGLNVPTFDYFLAFEKLELETLFIIFSGILLEKQIIIFGENSQDLTNICETLLSLINPLTWGCIYIPYLPIGLWETLHAMMPYIIGIDYRYKAEIKENMKLNDKLIIDLKLNTIENDEGIRLPFGIKTFLKRNLEEIIRKGKSLENILKIKQFFLNSMYLIINNISNFFIYKENLNSFNVVSSEIFNFQAFLENFHEDFEYFEFMETLSLNTMMFNKFLEDCFVFMIKGKNLTIIEDDCQYFLREIKKILKKNPGSLIFNIERNPDLFNELIQEQNLEIQQLFNRFALLPPEQKSLGPFYSKFLANKKPHKKPKTHENQLQGFFSRLNKSLETIPRFSGDLNSIKSPINKQKLLENPMKTKKKPIYQRLPSYEQHEIREGFSPNSKLISKIKSFYFYYHAIKRNQIYHNYRRITNNKKKYSEIIIEKQSEIKFSEKMTPFFKEIVIQKEEIEDFDNNVNKRLFMEENASYIDSAKKALRTMVNPQDSSCEVTPYGNFKKEPENFSQWFMDNSMKNVNRWDKIKEDLKEKEILDKRFGTRSLSPKKK